MAKSWEELVFGRDSKNNYTAEDLFKALPALKLIKSTGYFERLEFDVDWIYHCFAQSGIHDRREQDRLIFALEEAGVVQVQFASNRMIERDPINFWRLFLSNMGQIFITRQIEERPPMNSH